MDTLGCRIRAIRRSLRITQAALGHPLSGSYVSLIEHDRAVPSLRTLVAIAQRLQIRPGDLLDTVNFGTETEYTPGHAEDRGSIARST